jgi:hypothetical protein
MEETQKMLDYLKKSEASIKSLIEERKDLKLIKSIGFDVYFHRPQALLSLNPDDTISAKKEMFKLARATEFDFMWIRGLYPNYVKEYPSETPLVSYTINYFVGFLLCDHEEILTKFFQEAKEYINYRIGKNPDTAISYGLIFLMVNEKEKASEYMGELYKKGKYWCKWLGFTIAGILQNDISLIDQAIKQELKIHKKIQGKVYPNYCQRATALVKLAHRFGMSPDISDHRINKKMLEHEKVDFEDIDDLIKLTGITHQRTYKLQNY